MKLAEYQLSCDYCGTETRVTVLHTDEEPYHCPMCGNESYSTLIDADEDSDY